MAGSTLPFLASVVSVERSTAGEKQAAQCLELVALSLGSDRHQRTKDGKNRQDLQLFQAS